jgi:hypothetical protein
MHLFARLIMRCRIFGIVAVDSIDDHRRQDSRVLQRYKHYLHAVPDLGVVAVDNRGQGEDAALGVVDDGVDGRGADDGQVRLELRVLRSSGPCRFSRLKMRKRAGVARSASQWSNSHHQLLYKSWKNCLSAHAIHQYHEVCWQLIYPPPFVPFAPSAPSPPRRRAFS